MSWFPIIVLAVLALGFAIFVLKLEKRAWTMFAAVLTFGLAGYATQAAPEMPGAPKQARSVEKRASGEAMVESRRAMFNPDLPQTPYLTLSDGQARAIIWVSRSSGLAARSRREAFGPRCWLTRRRMRLSAQN